MNQRHETPSDESENDIIPKIGSGFKGKRRKGVRFQPKKDVVLLLQNILLLPLKVIQKINILLLETKMNLKQISIFHTNYHPKKIKKEIQRQKRS